MADASTASGLAFLRGRIGRATPGEPLLLFAHGSGFNAAIWRPTIERLARLRPALSAEVVAIDWTGHGKSRPLAGSGASAERFVWETVASRDMIELLATVRTPSNRPVIGIGHSFGGAGLVWTELRAPGTFAGMVLIEPIIRAMGEDATHPLVERTLRRRARLDLASLDDVAGHFGRRAYASWDADALRAYVARGFVPAAGGAGGFALACEPVTEASLYLGGMQSRAFDRLAEVRCPSAVAAGGDSVTLAADGCTNLEQHRAVAARLGACVLPVAVARGRGHAVPMEDPDWTARLVAAALDSFALPAGGGGADGGAREAGGWARVHAEWAELQASPPPARPTTGSPHARL